MAREGPGSQGDPGVEATGGSLVIRNRAGVASGASIPRRDAHAHDALPCPPTKSSAMPATSCCATSAGPGRRSSRRRGCWSIGAGGLGRAADPVSRGGRHRHDRHRRRRHGLPLEPAAAGDPRHAGYRPAEGRQRRRCGGAAQPGRRRRAPPVADRRRQRPRPRARYDLVADGSDNFETRYAVSDACFYEKRPLVTAALGQFDGSLTTIRAHETRPRRAAEPDLSLPLPLPAPARRDPDLRRGRRARRARRA